MKKITGLEFLAILFNSLIGAILLIDAIKNGSNGYIYTAAICLISSFIAGCMFQFHREVNELKEMYYTEVECNINQRNKIDYLDAELDEKIKEISELRQKHSRTKQLRSSGKFVAEPDESGITRDPKIGDKYLCIRDVDMGAYIAFTAGKEYSSRINGCITNNKDNGNHIIGKNFAKLHFKLLKP